ncbi:MAG: hypothetical protein ACRDEA_05080 [Microcystaceae cyanobacterium]
MNTHSASQPFISIIRTIAKAYGMDLDAPYGYLRLEQQPYPALIVEKMGNNLLSVAYSHGYKGIKSANRQILFQIEIQDEKEWWFPVFITQFGETCHVALLDPLNPIQLKAKGVEESVSFCDTWADELVEPHWHIKGKPSPQVRAAYRRFSSLAPGSLSPSLDEDDQPILQLHGNYLIEGNKTGLLALMEAAATALTQQTQGTVKVFDANAYRHLLQVKLSTDGA